MARDWDLLVTFLIPVHFLVVYLLLIFFRNGRESHQVLIVMLILSVFRVAAWIGVNADPDRHLQRAEVLTTPGLSGTFPVIYYEALGKAFWYRNDFERSRIWYERYLTIDSLNPRILGNLAADFDKLGMRERYFETLKRAAQSGTKEASIYLNLGAEYVARKDTASGIQMMNRALELNPALGEARANLAFLYVNQKKYLLASQYASKAIDLGVRTPILYLDAGYAYVNLGEYATALRYLDTYMAKVPHDTRVQSFVDAIRERMHKTPAGKR
jgi:tetratricopeptide (TPR) repeat protein